MLFRGTIVATPRWPQGWLKGGQRRGGCGNGSVRSLGTGRLLGAGPLFWGTVGIGSVDASVRHHCCGVLTHILEMCVCVRGRHGGRQQSLFPPLPRNNGSFPWETCVCVCVWTPKSECCVTWTHTLVLIQSVVAVDEGTSLSWLSTDG